MRIVEVESGSGLLMDVRRLWRTNSRTLGFFPDGAFEAHANEGCITAAIDDTGTLAGYCLYRVVRGRQLVIVHLCVDERFRGRGVARLLIQEVRRCAEECSDIVVRCRRDFAANAVWPRLGFIAVNEVSGRGKEPTILTVWRHEIAPLPLLVAMDSARDLHPVSVAIDANVFFDLDAHSPGAGESEALLADWLTGLVELCVTEELLNEIDRNADVVERTHQRGRAGRFRMLPRSIDAEERILPDLRTLLPVDASPRAESDVRQLAKTIAGNVSFFVTRDTLVQEAADQVYERFGLTILSPFQLILRIHEIEREDEYRPRRTFVGPGVKASRARADDLGSLVDLVHQGRTVAEPRRRTAARLRDILAQPDRFDCTVVRDDGGVLAAFAVERPTGHVLRVPFFGVAPSPMGSTAGRHFVEQIVTTAVSEERRVVLVLDPAPRTEAALEESGFSREDGMWIKLAVAFVGGPDELPATLEAVGELLPQARSLAERVAAHIRTPAQSESGRTLLLARVERALWPVKIMRGGIPNFIVPIQPQWARELFDREFAARDLFGADPRLMLNPENAYYRAAKPVPLAAPARILWYVSQHKAFVGSMSIRACSRLEEVVVGPPKEVYRQFRRLGVYGWSDVLQVAKNDLSSEIMGFRFSRTELFSHPVAWDDAQNVLKRRSGAGSQFQSPLRIDDGCFVELYHVGMGGTAGGG